MSIPIKRKRLYYTLFALMLLFIACNIMLMGIGIDNSVSDIFYYVF